MYVMFRCLQSCAFFMLVTTQDATIHYNMSCDPSGFVLGEVSGTPLQGTVDVSRINPSNCGFSIVTKIIFRLTMVSGAPTDICEMPYRRTNQTYITMGKQRCRYSGKQGNKNVYDIKLFFEERFLNGRLEITTDCVQRGLRLVYCENIDDVCRTVNCIAKYHCERPRAECVCDANENCDEICGFCDFSDCEDENNGRTLCIIMMVGWLVILLLIVVLVVLYCFFRTACEGVCGPVFRALDTCFRQSSATKPAREEEHKDTYGGPMITNQSASETTHQDKGKLESEAKEEEVKEKKMDETAGEEETQTVLDDLTSTSGGPTTSSCTPISATISS